MQGRRGHICVGGTGVNPLGTGEAVSLQTLECLSAWRGGNAWEPPVAAAPFPGPFFRNEQLSVTALQEVLSKQVWLNSGFLLQIQVNDNTEPSTSERVLGGREQPALGAPSGVSVSASF